MEIERLRAELDQLRRARDVIQRDANIALEQRRAMQAERDDARAVARVLAHSYTHDSRPPQKYVDTALAYPVLR